MTVMFSQQYYFLTTSVVTNVSNFWSIIIVEKHLQSLVFSITIDKHCLIIVLNNDLLNLVVFILLKFCSLVAFKETILYIDVIDQDQIQNIGEISLSK